MSEEDLRGEGSPIIRHPLEILPVEVWSIIFERLKDTKDLASCSRASLPWNEILASEKTLFLFPELLAVLANRNISPFDFTPYHSKCDVRNLRLVCRTWRNAINNYIQCHPCHYQLEEPSPTNDLKDYHRLKMKSAVIFSTPEALDSFQRSVSSYTGENPFLSRHIIFTDLNKENIQYSDRMWGGLKNMLSQWGSQIWYFEVVILSDHFFFQIYQNIRECIFLMPNLKVLELSPMEAMARRQLEVDWLRDIIRTSPLPRLEHLEVFSARLLPTPMMNETLSKFSNIRCLCIDKDSSVRHEYYDYDAENLNLPNLKELAVPLLSANDLVSLRRVRWSLESLTLTVSCKQGKVGDPDNADQWLDITDILSCVNYINSFSNTLKNLTIKLDGQTPWRAPVVRCSQINLNMNLLEKLVIQMKCVQMENIDFILNFKELKQLSIIMDSYQVGPSSSTIEMMFQSKRESEARANVKFFSYMEHMNMYNSNLWELLPNFKTLGMKLRPNARLSTSFNEYQFTRAKYDVIKW